MDDKSPYDDINYKLRAFTAVHPDELLSPKWNARIEAALDTAGPTKYDYRARQEEARRTLSSSAGRN